MSNLQIALAAVLVLGVITMACPQQPPVDGAGPEMIDLPPPLTDGTISVEAAIQARRSVRRFTSEPLGTEQVGQLAWAAQGITEAGRGLRATPSAGATYPLEIYVITADGAWSYRPREHALAPHIPGDIRERLAQAALGQDCVRTAPLIIAVTAIYERTAGRYGDRAQRYVHMEVGHLAQNVHLQAVAMGLGSVPVGAFDPGALSDCLRLPDEQVPLYLIPVGHPAG